MKLTNKWQHLHPHQLLLQYHQVIHFPHPVFHFQEVWCWQYHQLPRWPHCVWMHVPLPFPCLASLPCSITHLVNWIYPSAVHDIKRRISLFPTYWMHFRGSFINTSNSSPEGLALSSLHALQPHHMQVSLAECIEIWLILKFEKIIFVVKNCYCESVLNVIK